MKTKIQRGFTVIELMTTVALLAVMVVLGVPAFTSSVDRNETAANSNALLSALKVARSEATKRSQSVIVCASNNQADCASNNWSDGWLVFVDDVTQNGNLDTGETIITTYELPNGFSVARASGGADQIAFAATGLSNSSFAQNFTICKANTSNGRRLTVERSGLVAGADATCP